MTPGKLSSQAMDDAAVKAETMLASLDVDALCSFAGWWNRWFRTLGHRRLGRLIAAYPKLPSGEPGAPPPDKQASRLTRKDKEALVPTAARHLQGLPEEKLLTMVTWWKRWYAEAGHRRLGRALLAQAKERCPKNHRGHLDTPEAKRAQKTRKAKPASQPVAASIPGVSIPCAFRAGEVDDSSVFTVRVNGGQLEIVLNRLHPAFPHLAPLVETENNGSSEHLPRQGGMQFTRLLLEAWAYYEFEQPSSSPRVTPETARADWGRMLRRLILSVD